MRNPGGENFDRKYILPLKKYSLSLSLENEKVRRIPGHDNPRRQVFIKHYDLIGDPVALEALDHRVWPSYRAPETFISVDDDDVGNFYDRRLKPPPPFDTPGEFLETSSQFPAQPSHPVANCPSPKHPRPTCC